MMLIEAILQQAEASLIPKGYRLGDIVGVGGMGVVYSISSIDHQQEDLVMKMVHPLLSQSPAAEAQLKHEAEIELSLQGMEVVVETLSYGVHEKGHGYKIMRRMKGESLKAWLKKKPTTLSIKKAAQGLRLAVQAVHAAGIIHGDLKPSNIFIDSLHQKGEQFNIRLFDFGLARRLTDYSIGKQNFRAYSPTYASPAVLAGKLPTLEDDLYSLNAIFQKMGIAE